MESHVTGRPPLDGFTDGVDELLGLRGVEEARNRLLEDLVTTQAEQLRDGGVRLVNLALEVDDEYRVWCVGDDQVGRQHRPTGIGRSAISGGAGAGHRAAVLDCRIVLVAPGMFFDVLHRLSAELHAY